MKVLFTGATGVIGRQAIPGLINSGHDVTGVSRTQAGHQWLRSVGATPIELDLFSASAVKNAVAGNEAVIHMATAIPAQAEMTKRAAWAINDRLRTESTAHLVAAASAGDVTTFVQQSISFVYADGGDTWLDESSPVDTVWSVLDSAIEAERQVSRFEGVRGIVLRFSNLYGPRHVSAEYVASVAERKLPIVGSGYNYVSHLHIRDAGSAIIAALTAPGGVYNVTDDVPVTKRTEMESLASAVEAKPPHRIPRWLAKTMVGPAASLLAVSHRVSNRRFKEATGWSPAIRSVVDGWKDTVTSPAIHR